MRNVTLCLAIGIGLLSACTTSIPNFQAVSLRENLVMPAHNRPVDVFYLRESLGKKPVTELALIHLNFEGYATEDYLLQAAREKARGLGADGIFVLNREEYIQYFKGDIYDHPEVDRTEFRAVAFVYDENLQDSVRVHEAMVQKQQEQLKPKFFIKSEKLPQVNLYAAPEISTADVALVVTDSEPMQFLERTEVELYNPKRTLKSYVFKVRFREQELYVSGFDVVRKL